MRQMFWKALLVILLASCASSQTADDRRPTTDDRPPAPALSGAEGTDAPTIAPTTAAATFAPTTIPTAIPATVTPTAAPTAAPPTSAPTTEPTAAPTAEPPTATPAEPPTAVPATIAPTAPPAPPEAPLDPQAQAAALLPDFRGDLGRAGDWNRYTIDAAIDPDARTISGRLRLEYTNRDSVPLAAIYFHLYPNLADFAGQLDVTVLAVDGQTLPVAYELRRYLLRVDLPQPLAPGGSTAVTMDFATRAPLNASGQYGAFNKEGGVLALASSYPIAAIVRGGAWDIGDPDGRGDFVNSETALYDVTLTAPADWQLITTGVVLDGRLDAGQQAARIVSGPQRDFMISLAQYGVASGDAEGTRVNSYYRPGHEAGGQAALQAAVNAVQAFNARYGRYPLAELDVIEVNASSFLGVEYPGVILMQSNLYAQRGGLEITVAHEVGHQWWYSLVGNNVQTEAWLDEALASYSQIVYQEQIYGPEAAERELEGFRQRYRDAVAAGRDAPVDQPTSAFRGNYVAIVYGKAVLFFQALREQIGDPAFDAFLHDYYAQHRYGYIGGANLLASAEGACGCELDGLYQAWIEGVGGVEVP
jgi:aminopeptidase N